MTGLKPRALRELRVPDVMSKYKNVEPTEIKPVASYNWTGEETPTMLVPGCPPIWQDKALPFKVPRDIIVDSVGQNRFHAPRYPLLPLFTAINYLDPGFDFAAIDIVTDRNHLRNLVRWIDGTIKRGFRIDLQPAGATTVLFARQDFPSSEFNPGWQGVGYGFNFEAFTTKSFEGCEKSTGHFRVITYKYGGLKLLIRFELDACLDFEPTMQGGTSAPRSDFLDPSKSTIETEDNINIIPAGVLAPQSKLIEMTTRSVRSIEGFDWQDYFPQLFLSQTPHSFIGIHERGQFQRIEAGTLGDVFFSEQQRTQQTAFDKLCVLLEDIYRIAVNTDAGTRLSIVYSLETKKLEVFERESAADSLPDSWMRRLKARTLDAEAEFGKGTKETRKGVVKDNVRKEV
ncbi:hypothetical protein M0805_000665 [Coniferiporia weirii]|nr:hypothetical protein M0805_000665 [Coniferiporia weirii]